MTGLLLDTMLGRLATYLRMCGYDTAYALDESLESDDTLLEYARDTDRTILTRDRELARRYEDSLLLESREITDQLQEVADAGYTLELPETPTRCGVCNGTLTQIPPDTQTPAYAPDPVAVECWQCEDCGQFFWKGSHWDDVAETLASID